MSISPRKFVSVHWFRHGLRFHDNPSMCESLSAPPNCYVEFYPVFIFDGEVAGTATCGFNRMRFLHESLVDLDKSFQAVGTRLHIFHGDPVEVFNRLFREWGVERVTFEQDPEPIWQERDNRIKALCDEQGVQWTEIVSHNLWDPNLIIEENGGNPPVTYAEFQLISSIVGLPPRPAPEPDFTEVTFGSNLGEEFERQFGLASLEDLGFRPELEMQLNRVNAWRGGETIALKLLAERIIVERQAYESGYVMPNHVRPNLVGPPNSLSAHLRFGCLSIRRFYWSLRDAYSEICNVENPNNTMICQLLWREYFYTMSVGNPNYNRIEGNPICLSIPWKKDEDLLSKFEKAETGFPWIDACVQQLWQEGWIHHAARHALACFVTRGDLWISWEDGLRVFDRLLLDADWSVCAGSWMWVSSSAFEKVLQCPRCFCPVNYGRKLDPKGEYVRRYLPQLRHMPLLYLFEPWKAPLSVQRKAKCIIGKDYPLPCVDHSVASRENRRMMEEFKADLVRRALDNYRHCRPTSSQEVESFVWIPPELRNNRHHLEDE